MCYLWVLYGSLSFGLLSEFHSFSCCSFCVGAHCKFIGRLRIYSFNLFAFSKCDFLNYQKCIFSKRITDYFWIEFESFIFAKFGVTSQTKIHIFQFYIAHSDKILLYILYRDGMRGQFGDFGHFVKLVLRNVLNVWIIENKNGSYSLKNLSDKSSENFHRHVISSYR